VIPLISSPGILGFLVVGCSRPETEFRGTEEGVLESLGREVGGAIERVQLGHDLEEALKQVNLYLDIMVHDINNDTTAALGYGDLLRERLDGEAADHLNRVLSRIRHSAETISDVSTIRKIRSSAAVLQQIPLDPVIRQEIGQFPDIDIRYAGTGLSVCADELVSVIFTNLLSNSVKYGGPGVRIEIAVTESSGWAGITVRDNGPGIPESLRPHLFERFSHGQAKKSGMGLGLYLTRMLVERYGGTIRVDDPPGTEERPGFSVTFRLKVPSFGEEACGAARERGR
jgi:signal transduction histidine kinase